MMVQVSFVEAVDIFDIPDNILIKAFDFGDVDGDTDFDCLFTGYNTSNLIRITTLWENLLYSTAAKSSTSSNFNINFDENEVSFGSDFKLFPNPTDKGYFNINTPGIDGKVSVTVTDLQGRTILSQNMDVQDENVRVKSEYLSAGIYIVRLSKGQNTFSSKLIVK